MSWPRVKLKFVARLQYGDALPPDDEREDGPVEVWGSNGPYATFIRANTLAPVIVVGRKGSYGKLNWGDVPVYASDTTFFIDANSTQYNLRWLYYALQSLGLDSGSEEAAVPGLNRETAYNRELLLPPLLQQQQLAAQLDHETARLDALVAAKQEQLELIAEKRRALITRAVTQGLDADAPRRATGLPWLGKVPAHWEVVRLKMVSHSLQTGPFGSQLHAEEYIDGGIPVINPAHMRDGKIIPDDQITVSEETSERLAVHRLAVGDLVFARRGELGRCSVVSENEVGWLCGTGSLRARLDTKRISPTYLQLYVEFTGVPDWLSTQSVGSTMDNLNTEILGDLGICLPSIREQKLILAYVAAETEKIAELQQITESSLALMHERRAALIAAAVTGKLELMTS